MPIRILKSIYHFILAWLGSVIYKNPSREIFVLGVTGTKGKSTVLELINAILEAAGKKTAMISSVRFKIGSESRKNLTDNTMPGRFFIQKFLSEAVKAGCEYALLEVTSEGIVQYRHRFIDFDAALFLNLQPEHIERHGTFHNYRAAKVKFFSDIANKSQKPAKLFFINQEDLNSGYFTDASAGRGGVYYFGRENFIETRLARGRVSIGNWLKNDFNLENAAAATRFAETQGISWEITKRALINFKGVPGRMDVIQEEPFRIVIDYAHTPDSLEKVYQTLRNANRKPQIVKDRRLALSDKRLAGRLICVLGSAGGGRDRWKRPVLGKIAARYCQKVILTNEDPYNENPDQVLSQIAAGCAEAQNKACEVERILDRRTAIKTALGLARQGDTVVLTGKGSENWMHLARGEKIPWDEKEIVKQFLRIKNQEFQLHS